MYAVAALMDSPIPPQPCAVVRGVRHELNLDIRPGRPLRTDGMKLDRLWLGPRGSRQPTDLAATLAFVLGAALIIWSGSIHLDLWNSGYRNIGTIGTLFMLQFIGGLVVGLVVLVARRVWAALVGIGFGLSTIGGFLLSVTHGLFGFKDSWAAPFAKEAFAVEISIVVVLTIAGALCLARSAPAATITTPVATPS
jgi:hypothetical protein